MAYFTFLLTVEATVEGPDAGEAGDTLDDAVWGQLRVLRSISTGTLIGYLGDVLVHGRAWPASAVEVTCLQRFQQEDAPARKARPR